MLLERLSSATGQPSATQRETTATPGDGQQAKRYDHVVLLVTIVTTGVGAALLGLLLAFAPPVTLFAVAVAVAVTAGTRYADKVSPEWIGAFGWAALAYAASGLLMLTSGSWLRDTGITFLALTLATGGTVVLWARHALAAKETDLRRLATAANRIFTRPTSGLAPALIGAGAAWPLLGAYAPNVIDSDSGWMAASMQEARHRGPDLIFDAQEVLLPHVTISPILGLGGHRAGVLFTIGTMIALAALTAYLAYRIAGTSTASLAAVATLLAIPALVEQTDYYPMYAAAYAFAYGGAWLIHRAMSEDGRWWWAVGGGLCVVLAVESHNVAQLFLVTPFLLLVLHPWRRARSPLAITLLTMAVASVPRILINLPADSLSSFRSNYNTWFVQNGYIRVVNLNFHGQDVKRSPLAYLSNVPDLVEGALGGQGTLLLAAAPFLIAAVMSRGRSRAFCLVVAGFFFLALVVAAPGTYPRYVTPLAVGMTLIVAVGVSRMTSHGGEARAVGRLLLTALVLVSATGVVSAVETKADRHQRTANGSLQELADRVDDDSYILGVRSHELARLDPTLRTFSGRLMAEEDFVTYLTWPDDETVDAMMERLNIGWVYLRPDPRIEVGYNDTWVSRFYDERVRHPLQIADSDHFCLAVESGGYRLYRRGECEAGDEGMESDLGSRDPRLNEFRVDAGLPPVPDGTGAPEAIEPDSELLEEDSGIGGEEEDLTELDPGES